MIFHLPHGELLQARLAAERSTMENRRPLLNTASVLTGTIDDARRWAALASRLPDARADVSMQGGTLLATGQKVRLFSGKEIRYSKDVARTKRGAWRIVEGTIRPGIELQIGVVRGARGLHVELVAQHTEVDLPLPVVEFQPSQRAVPVELERPEWSTTRLTCTFLVPSEGGGAFVHLRGIGSSPEDQVVLVLTIAPNPPAPQQSAAGFSKRGK